MRLTESEKARRLQQAYNDGRAEARRHLLTIEEYKRATAVRDFPPADPRRESFPPVEPYAIPVSELTKLRTSCLFVFEKKPLKNIPQIFVEEDAHFTKPTIYAHYHPDKDTICFRSGYLQTATPQSLLDTMKHELLHAWIHQHDFKGDRAHDDVFKAAADLLGIHWWEGLRES